MTIQLFAMGTNGKREEIIDLFWFEENGVENWDGVGYLDTYRFEILINGQCVYPLSTPLEVTGVVVDDHGESTT